MGRTKKPKPDLVWKDIPGDDGTVRGRYAINAGTIIVQSAQGWRKTTQLGSAPPDMLARIIVSEPPPDYWRAPS